MIYYPDPLIFIIKDKNNIIPIKDSKESEKYKNSKDYLNHLKEALDLPNEVENEVEINDIKYKSLISIIEDNNYVITNDNFKKMVLLF